MSVHRIDTDYARSEPRRVLEEALAELPDDAIAVAVFVQDSKDRITEQSACFQRKDLLWMLTIAIQRLTGDDDEL